MKFLEDYGFSQEEFEELMNNTTKKLIDKLEEHEDLVRVNLQFVKDLGTSVYKEIFINYPDIFLLDASVFAKTFTQYETDELIESLNNNFKVVEYL